MEGAIGGPGESSGVGTSLGRIHHHNFGKNLESGNEGSENLELSSENL